MPWLYNKDTGDVLHQNSAEWLADEIVPGQADINLNLPDSDTQAQALAAAQAYAKAHGTTTPTTSSSTANANAEKTVENNVPGVSTLSDVMQGISSASLWIRVAKVSLGSVLILIAVAKMTGAESAISKIPVPIPM